MSLFLNKIKSKKVFDISTFKGLLMFWFFVCFDKYIEYRNSRSVGNYYF